MPQSDPFWFILGGLVGGLFTLAVRGGLRWWQYRRELWLGHVERMIDALDQFAERGTDYWLSANPPGSPGDNTSDKQEARLLGLQIRLDGTLEALIDRLSEHDAHAINHKMNDLTAALTGGDFGSRKRDPDPNRARLAQMYASELIVLISAAADRALTAGGLLLFMIERAKRRQRAAEEGRRLS